jgi:hypothetical protein
MREDKIKLVQDSHVSEQTELHHSICLSGCTQAGAGINFHQPRLKMRINENIIPVAFEAVSVINHHVLSKRNRFGSGRVGKGR